MTDQQPSREQLYRLWVWLEDGAHPDDIEWGEKETEESVGPDGEHWYIGYEPERDYVRVIGREVVTNDLLV